RKWLRFAILRQAPLDERHDLAAEGGRVVAFHPGWQGRVHIVQRLVNHRGHESRQPHNGTTVAMVTCSVAPPLWRPSCTLNSPLAVRLRISTRLSVVIRCCSSVRIRYAPGASVTGSGESSKPVSAVST